MLPRSIVHFLASWRAVFSLYMTAMSPMRRQLLQPTTPRSLAPGSSVCSQVHPTAANRFSLGSFPLWVSGEMHAQDASLICTSLDAPRGCTDVSMSLGKVLVIREELRERGHGQESCCDDGVVSFNFSRIPKNPDAHYEAAAVQSVTFCDVDYDPLPSRLRNTKGLWSLARYYRCVYSSGQISEYSCTCESLRPGTGYLGCLTDLLSTKMRRLSVIDKYRYERRLKIRSTQHPEQRSPVRSTCVYFVYSYRSL